MKIRLTIDFDTNGGIDSRTVVDVWDAVDASVKKKLLSARIERRMGRRRGPLKTRLTDEVQQRIIEMHEAEYSLREIVDELGGSPSRMTVHRIVQQYEIDKADPAAAIERQNDKMRDAEAIRARALKSLQQPGPAWRSGPTPEMPAQAALDPALLDVDGEPLPPMPRDETFDLTEEQEAEFFADDPGYKTGMATVSPREVRIEERENESVPVTLPSESAPGTEFVAGDVLHFRAAATNSGLQEPGALRRGEDETQLIAKSVARALAAQGDLDDEIELHPLKGPEPGEPATDLSDWKFIEGEPETFIAPAAADDPLYQLGQEIDGALDEAAADPAPGPTPGYTEDIDGDFESGNLGAVPKK